MNTKKVTQEIVNKFIGDNNLQPLVIRIEELINLVNKHDRELAVLEKTLVNNLYEAPVFEAAFKIIDFAIDNVLDDKWAEWWLYEARQKPTITHIPSFEEPFTVKDIRDLVFAAKFKGEEV